MTKKYPLNSNKIIQDDIKNLSQSDNLSVNEKNMTEQYYYVIEAVASIISSKKKLPPSIDYNDLLSAGFTGLVKAIRKFSADKNVEFKTYANIRVRGEMLDLIRKEWSVKNPGSHQEFQQKIKNRVEEAMGAALNEPGKINVTNLLALSTTSYVVSLDAVTDEQGDRLNSNEMLSEEKVLLEDEYQGLNLIIDSLDKEETTFINLFYRLGYSQKKIAQEFNVSEATISRMHVDILKKLKNRMKSPTC